MRLPYLVVFAVGVAFGSRMPHPPIFTAVESYPSICYLPPGTVVGGYEPEKQGDSERARERERSQTVTAEPCDFVAKLTPNWFPGGSQDSGLCPTTNKDDSEETQDLLTRYYFDMATEQCYPFGVQSCGGNENRFPSKTACLAYCRIEKTGSK
ncbi:hypothetical protein PRIPAC_70564 [Pristionchus pacificus]|uniref:BPTI/Kunitz inhibitor domain-containing protein n=1 Tax=Pristionchus pacificus TaxID=54126 RepID=A0A2A6BZY1_PRIPA|nr:hypothetical protein PRIPAC_70564 [Pristionchus pacificus]|eukprot:PDM71406.1 hypothetical protein PRIPAC_37813 [Pristionchus pacificus]